MCILKVKMDPKLLTATCQNSDFEDKGSIFMTSRQKKSPLQEKKTRLEPDLWTAMPCSRGRERTAGDPGEESGNKRLTAGSDSGHSLLRNLLEGWASANQDGIGKILATGLVGNSFKCICIKIYIYLILKPWLNKIIMSYNVFKFYTHIMCIKCTIK